MTTQTQQSNEADRLVGAGVGGAVGGVIGAAIGGPVGAGVGAAVGGWLGHVVSSDLSRAQRGRRRSRS
jgi:outer membrane lipoprotein SlyB